MVRKHVNTFQNKKNGSLNGMPYKNLLPNERKNIFLVREIILFGEVGESMITLCKEKSEIFILGQIFTCNTEG